MAISTRESSLRCSSSWPVPEFLFRIETDPADVPAGAKYRVSDLALASRLSFFLWSSLPDEQLLDLAAQKKLHEPAVLEQQVKRMLADPKVGCPDRQLRRAVAVPAQSEERVAEPGCISGFRR